ncbi:MAG: glycosyltransferase family 2 protein [Candidatus Yanofskybacteria bacterium]|nr:glycosyltransferase family 2 protein [Candidatus Yanofskybacteria bacterium]
MSNPLVTIHLVVLNGEKYIRHCLDAILTQTYPHEYIELNILDNGSTDRTKAIIKEWESFDKIRIPKFTLIESKVNLGMWPGQEELLKHSHGKYILAMAVDVLLDKDFVANAVKRIESDGNIGALEAKIYRFDLQPTTNNPQFTKVIDTVGFQIFKSRRIRNIGHGELDNGQFNKYMEIFGVEGAAPFFRREALEDIRIKGQLIDHDYFWYGDDLDLAWRMRLFGWKEVFDPEVIAWHDRQTTKTLKKSPADFIKIRRAIPIKKRGLDWRNTRWTILKNDYIINILKDLPAILKREIQMAGYILFFEPAVLLEIPKFIVVLPKMFMRRREIMKRATAKSAEMRKWFN